MMDTQPPGKTLRIIQRLDLLLGSELVGKIAFFGAVLILNFLQLLLATSILANSINPILAVVFILLALLLLLFCYNTKNEILTKRIYLAISIVTLILNLTIAAPFLLLYGKLFACWFFLSVALIGYYLLKRRDPAAIFIVFVTWIGAAIIAIALGYLPMIVVTLFSLVTLVIAIVSYEPIEKLVVYRPFLFINQISLLLALQTVFFGLPLPVYGLDKIVAQPGVEKILTNTSDDPKFALFDDGLQQLIYPRILNVVGPSCDNEKIFVGFTMASDSPILLDLTHNSAGRIEGLVDEELVSLASDCGRGLHYFLLEKSLQIVGEKDGAFTAYPAIQMKDLLAIVANRLDRSASEKLLAAENAYQLAADTGNEKIYFSHKYGDLSFEISYSDNGLQFGDPITSTILIPDGETLYLFTRSENIKLRHGVEISRAPQRYNVDSKFTNIALNRKNNKLYKSKFFSGDIAIIDTRDLKQIKLLNLKNGTRSILYSEKFGMLITANYTTGEVTLIDGDTDKTIAVYDFGWRVRNMAFDRSKQLVIVPCAHGIFTLDLARVKPLGNH